MAELTIPLQLRGKTELICCKVSAASHKLVERSFSLAAPCYARHDRGIILSALIRSSLAASEPMNVLAIKADTAGPE